MARLTFSEWDEYLARHTARGQYSCAHILQQGAWGELKAGFGWDVVRLQAGGGAAQVLFRRLPLGLTFGYIPKGPIGADWLGLWPELDRLCRSKRAIFLKVEPDAWQPLAPERLAQ